VKIKMSVAVLLASDVFYNCLTCIHLHVFTFLAHFPYLKEKRLFHKIAMPCPARLQLLDQMTGCHKTRNEPYTYYSRPPQRRSQNSMFINAPWSVGATLATLIMYSSHYYCVTPPSPRPTYLPLLRDHVAHAHKLTV